MERDRKILRAGATLAVGAVLGFAAANITNQFPENPILVDCPPIGMEFTIDSYSGPINVIARSGYIIGDATVNGGRHFATDFQHYAVTRLSPLYDKCTLFKIDAPLGAKVYVGDKNDSVYDAEGKTSKRLNSEISANSGKQLEFFMSEGLR